MSEVGAQPAVNELRAFVHDSFSLLSAAQTSLALRIALNSDRLPTTRSAYLLTLEERIGPPPLHGWEDEWPALMQALSPWESSAESEEHTKPVPSVLSLLGLDDNGSPSTSRWRSVAAAGDTRAERGTDLLTLLRDPSHAFELIGADVSASSLGSGSLRGSARRNSGQTAGRPGSHDVEESARPRDSRARAETLESGRFEDRATPEDYVRNSARQIEQRVKEGWSPEDARAFEVLCNFRGPLARALRAGDCRFSASTYAIIDALSRAASTQRAAGSTLPPHLYRNLHGERGLISDDPAWMNIEHADLCGFRGLTSSSMVRAFCKATSLQTGGYVVTLKDETGKKGKPLIVDSPVVRFESAEEDAQGYHTAVMVGADRGAFPPNTLFAVKRIEPRFQFRSVDKVTGATQTITVEQKLYVVSATWRKPQPNGPTKVVDFAKLCGAVSTLNYGRLGDFAKGLDCMSVPGLSMEHEFDRDETWYDWKGVKYSLRQEWYYAAVGKAATRPYCTPGTRDADHDGWTVDDFMHAANEYVRKRRERIRQTGRSTQTGFGRALTFDEAHAYLDRNEVIAVRLYTGPVYQVINEFLRQLGRLSGSYQMELARHPGLSFSATASHLCSAIRKLADCAMDDDYQQPLWRAVRGELPPTFWIPDDECGNVCAVDMGFMSTTRTKPTAIGYMSEELPNVLWELRPEPPSAEGFHFGADVSMLSQFGAESEILFPPTTLLKVLPRGLEEISIARQLSGAKAVKAFLRRRAKPPPPPPQPQPPQPPLSCEGAVAITSASADAHQPTMDAPDASADDTESRELSRLHTQGSGAICAVQVQVQVQDSSALPATGAGHSTGAPMHGAASPGSKTWMVRQVAKKWMHMRKLTRISSRRKSSRANDAAANRASAANIVAAGTTTSLRREVNPFQAARDEFMLEVRARLDVVYVDKGAGAPVGSRAPTPNPARKRHGGRNKREPRAMSVTVNPKHVEIIAPEPSTISDMQAVATAIADLRKEMRELKGLVNEMNAKLDQQGDAAPPSSEFGLIKSGQNTADLRERAPPSSRQAVLTASFAYVTYLTKASGRVHGGSAGRGTESTGQGEMRSASSNEGSTDAPGISVNDWATWQNDANELRAITDQAQAEDARVALRAKVHRAIDGHWKYKGFPNLIDRVWDLLIKNRHLELVDHLESDEDTIDGKVSIWRSVPDGCLVIAWRGSESFANAKQDIYSAGLCRFTTDEHLFSQGRQSDSHRGLRVGRGFQATYVGEGLNTRVRRVVMRELEKNEYSMVCIVGHSLGAALATFNAYELGMARPDMAFHVALFGSPRAVNPRFCHRLSTMANLRIYRYVNGLDPVCRIPMVYMGFRHVGMCVYIATWQAAVKAPMPFGKQPMLLQFCRTELLMGLVEGVPQHEMESYLTNMEGFDWKACNHHRGS